LPRRTSGAFSLGFLVSAMLSPSLGRLMDRCGPRVVLELGVGLMAVGRMLATLMRQSWHLCAILGVMVGVSSTPVGRSGRREAPTSLAISAPRQS
jgi:MFS family permease